MIDACSESSEFPVPGAKGKLLWFKNSQCLLQPSRAMVYGVCYSIGYLLYDIQYYVNHVPDTDSTKPQMIAHHIVAILALIIALLSGYDMIGVAAGFMLCEVSSIFLVFKLL